MTNDDLRHTVLAALAEIAPEVDPSAIDGDIPLRDQLDIDSMDFLNFAIAVNERTGLEIPERDYPALGTLNGCVDYLARAGAPPR
jgi:acyl carrier protein